MSKGSSREMTVVERSPASCRYVFGELLHGDGIIDEVEWGVFQKLYDQSAGQFTSTPKVCIFIHTPVSICFERALERGREAEATLSLSYLEKLKAKYLKFIDIQRGHKLHFEAVYTIDGARSKEEVLEAVISCIEVAKAM